MDVLFREEQKFDQAWIWLILLFALGIPLFGLFMQLGLDRPFGNKPMSNTGLVVWAICGVGLVIFFRMLKLTTIIDRENIHIKFFPFTNKKIKWAEVNEATVLDYGFVGGWGVRYFTKYGTAYNVKGSKGLALELNNKKKLLIGTQQEAALDAAVKDIKQFV